MKTRLCTTAILTATAGLTGLGAIQGFAPSLPLQSRSRFPQRSTLHITEQEDTPCVEPVGANVEYIASQKGSGKLLRSARLTNANGESIVLGNLMGKGTSVVVFLRHLA